MSWLLFLLGCFVGFDIGIGYAWHTTRRANRRVTVNSVFRLRGEELARHVTKYQQRKLRRNPVVRRISNYTDTSKP